MRHLTYAIVAGAACLGMAASANAALIGLTGGSPDVSMTGTITYTDLAAPLTAGAGTFSLSGNPIFETPLNVNVNPTKSFTLTINIMHGANPGDPISVTSATLSVVGDIGSGSTTLFTGSGVPQFGFQTGTSSPNFDVLFPSGSGFLDSLGGQIGLTIGAGNTISNYSANLFTQTFTSANSSADTFVVTSVPEPASLSLAGLSCAGLLLRRRRR